MERKEKEIRLWRALVAGREVSQKHLRSFLDANTNSMPPTSDVCLLGSLVFQWQLQIFRGWFVNGVFFLALGMRTVIASLNIAKSRIQK